MSLFNRKTKVDDHNSQELLVDPEKMPEPDNPGDYLRRGYAFYARSMFPQAEQDFRKGLAMDPEGVDLMFALGMALKGDKRDEESVQVFKQVLSLLNAGAVADRTRRDMLHRLAVGHINMITKGDWNLEQETWQRSE